MSITEVKTFPTTVVHFPAIDAESTVDVGESIVSATLKGMKPAIKLLEKIENFKVSLVFGTKIINIPAGTFTYYGENSSGVFYNALSGYIYLPKDQSKTNMVCYVPDAAIICEPIPSLADDVNMQKTQVDFYPKAALTKQLVYTGGNKKAITLTYREFINDLARPAFSQELKYDISEDNVIGFKGARFEVLGASNIEIKFKVLKHLN